MDFLTFEKIAKNTQPEEGIFARFYDRTVKTGRIDKHGFPVFENVCFCEIRLKDNNSEVFDQPATEEKKKRFPAEYARYLLAKKQAEKGSPLEQFAFLTASEIESLKIRGIFTVEALAELDVQKAEDLGVARERALAVKFTEQAASNTALAGWQEKEEKYKSKIKKLEEQLKSLKKNRACREGE